MSSTNGPLVLADQLATEALALKLFNSEPVTKARAEARRLLLATDRAKTAAGAQVVDQNADEITFHACTAAAQDPERPGLVWSINLPHEWHGQKIFGARCGIDNPDTLYRFIPIDEQSSYVITGKLPACPPNEMTMNLLPVYPGDIDNAEGVFPDSLGAIALKNLDFDADGNFKITVDPSPANGRLDHIQAKPGSKMILMRDALGDWARETPTRVAIERVAGPPAKPALSDDERAELAASMTRRSILYWIACTPHYYFREGPNIMYPAINPAFVKGTQYICIGNFKLNEDEAYIVTIDTQQARYVGFQLADLFGAAFDYAHFTSSRNQTQADPNADGTFTYVISMKDPGAHNWLDTTGFDAGVTMIRVQNLDPETFDPSKVILSQQVVKRSELKSILPPETRWLSEVDRRTEKAERFSSYMHRIGDDSLVTPNYRL